MIKSRTEFIWEQQRIAICDKQAMVTIGKPGERKRGACFYRGEEEVGGVILNKSPLQKSKSFKVIMTYWMS